MMAERKSNHALHCRDEDCYSEGRASAALANAPHRVCVQVKQMGEQLTVQKEQK
jgi:hypothetical protein